MLMRSWIPVVFALLGTMACGGGGGDNGGGTDTMLDGAVDTEYADAPDGAQPGDSLDQDVKEPGDGTEPEEDSSDTAGDSTTPPEDGAADLGCIPNCGSAVCGDDGCGGSCGTCRANQRCVSGGKCAQGAAWTVLVYMVADNDLEGYSFQNLEEMSAAAEAEDVKIVVQADWIDGMEYRDSNSWKDQDYASTWRMLMTKDGYQKLADLGEKDMASQQVLADFISFGIKSYPAEHYALMFWDHGGALEGFGWDETSNWDALYPTELADAIALGMEKAGLEGNKLDLVGFDACIMGTWEVVSLLEPVATYVLASEELVHGPGMDYSAFSAAGLAQSAEELGQTLITAYMHKAVDDYGEELATMSLLDMSKLAAFSGAWENLLAPIQSNLGVYGPILAEAQAKAQYFGFAEDSEDDDAGLIDMGDLALKLGAASADLAAASSAFMDSLAALVIAEDHEDSGTPAATGLAVHFPIQEALFFRDLLVTAEPPAFWLGFLDAWYAWIADNWKVQLSEVLYDPASSGGDNGWEWVELYNPGTLSVDLVGWSLAWGGSDFDYGHIQLAGVLEPGDCVVVGGPQTSPANGSPTYFQAKDFSPDIQNGGAVADGVALFDVPSKEIDPQTVPFDAVLYGATNSSGLLDETGKAGTPDVATAPAGSSIERTATGWQIQAKPSPGICNTL